MSYLVVVHNDQQDECVSKAKGEPQIFGVAGHAGLDSWVSAAAV